MDGYFQKALALISFGIIILDGSLETIYKIFMNISQFFFYSQMGLGLLGSLPC